MDQGRGAPYQWTTLDFLAWRDQLESIEDLGAFRPFPSNLITGDGRGAPVASVEISASAFRVTRVPPLHGRPLLDQDEEVDAPRVVVIGYDVWRTRFNGDPEIIGKTVRLGSVTTAVVGVMPAGFRFPMSEELWVPLRTGGPDHGRLDWPDVNLFGRLAAGVSMGRAQAELTALAEGTSADSSEEPVRPRLAAYPELMRWGSGWSVPSGPPWHLVLLLLVAAANLGILVFARSVTRTSEIALRIALGASRTRIIAQLFVEALSLVSLAAGVVLLLGNWGLSRFQDLLLIGIRLPFWWTPEISLTSVIYVGVLTLLAATVIGVLPALKVTRGALGSGVQRASTGGSGLRFGRLPTTVIVAQVAISVALLTLALEQLKQDPVFLSAEGGQALRTEEYLGTRLYLDGEATISPPDESDQARFFERYRAAREQLAQRVAADPAVLGVTFTNALPVGPAAVRRIEVEGAALPLGSGAGHQVRALRVDSEFFDVMGGAILAGRGLTSPLTGGSADQPMVVVDQAFASQFFGDLDAVGRRLRYVTRAEEGPSPWLEIVGVVRDMGLNPGDPARAPALYESVDPASYRLFMVVHTRGSPAEFAPELRAISTAMNPSLRLERLVSLDRAASEAWTFTRFQRVFMSLLGATALALCLAGIYALMSFVVAQRRREIGIRIALGAHPQRVVKRIFGRALTQLGLGIAAGVLLVVFGMGAAAMDASGSIVIVTAGVMVSGLLACALPTRRALGVEPTEAFKEV